jgi:hypothetical protein
MARPQGNIASITGRATGKVRIRVTVARMFQPRSKIAANLQSEKFDLTINFPQPFVKDKSTINNRLIFWQFCQVLVLDWEKFPKLSQCIGGSDGGSSDRTREVKLLEQWVINFIIVSFDNFISDGLPSQTAI